MKTRLAILILGAASLAGALSFSGCGSKCGPSNCVGCCDGSGKCEAPADAHCGINGTACVACTGLLVCDGTAGVCAAPSGTGANGSSGGTGITTAGGSTSATNGSGSSGSTSSSTGSNGSSGSMCLNRQSCTYDNDCGGSNSCLNGCCVQTADTCNDGSAAYGPCAPGTAANASDCCVPGGSSNGTAGTNGTNGTSASIGSTGTTASSTGGSTGQSTTGGWMCTFDGGIFGGSCQPECNRGFHCEGNACVLNGGGGDIQVTLRFDTYTDLDLHVVEPGGCEVYYGNTMCVGSLDLDSNAGCGGQGDPDAENVIYPDGGVLPTGTYTVRVDDWDNCSSLQSIPYEVIIRHHGQVDTYCEGFGTPNPMPGDPLAPDDMGSAGAGTTIATFTYP